LLLSRTMYLFHGTVCENVQDNSYCFKDFPYPVQLLICWDNKTLVFNVYFFLPPKDSTFKDGSLRVANAE
jgi:hypothetical protein